MDLIHSTHRLRDSHPLLSLCRLPLAAGVLAGVRGLAAPAPRLHLHHRQVPAARPQRPLRRPRHTLQARLHSGGKLLGFWEIMHFELNILVSQNFCNYRKQDSPRHNSLLECIIRCVADVSCGGGGRVPGRRLQHLRAGLAGGAAARHELLALRAGQAPLDAQIHGAFRAGIPHLHLRRTVARRTRIKGRLVSKRCLVHC